MYSNQLPTGFQVMQHMLHLKKQKKPDRSYKMNEAGETAKLVLEIWGKSNIPLVSSVSSLTKRICNMFNRSSTSSELHSIADFTRNILTPNLKELN